MIRVSVTSAGVERFLAFTHEYRKGRIYLGTFDTRADAEAAYERRRPSPIITLTCGGCGSDFQGRHYDGRGDRRYCSRACKENSYKRAAKQKTSAARINTLARMCAWCRVRGCNGRRNTQALYCSTRCHEHAQVVQRYGLSVEDYHALVAHQRGVCAICEQRPRSYSRLSIDHDHSTGAVRGLLCEQCNYGLGNFRDDVQRLQRAADYVQRTPYDTLKQQSSAASAVDCTERADLLDF